MVIIVIPFGKLRPSASVKQFIELAVNMPEHSEPQVERSYASMCIVRAGIGGDHHCIDQIQFVLRQCCFARFHQSAETNTTGMFSRMAALSMPGVILSQLEIHTIASAQCALTIYSTESAIRSPRASCKACRRVHGDTVVHCDRVEFFCDAASGLDFRATNCPRSRDACPGTNWARN